MTKHCQNKKNKEGLKYWENAWGNVKGVQTFPLHSSIIEEAKWKYLQEDLKGYSGDALEVGCGSGHIGSLLAESGFNVFLLDYSPSALECAKKSFLSLGGRERKSYVPGNAFSLPFKDESIDVVVSCGVLEHFEHPEIIVNEMSRVLRKGGLFYSDICPKKISLLRLIEMMHPKHDGWYEKKMNKRMIRQMLQNEGLEVKRILAAGVLPPRCIPGTGRFKLLADIELFIVKRLKRLWISLDNTPVADLLGSYYYVSAYKPKAH